MFKDERKLASRSLDDTMKVWDVRSTKYPIWEWKDLTNLSTRTNVTFFGKNEDIVLTGTSVRKGFGFYGLLCGFDMKTGE